MLIVTAKIPRRALKWGGVLTTLMLCIGVLLPSFSALHPAVRETAAAALPDGKGVRSNEDRIAYLNAFGWELTPDPIAIQELRIPSEMDESYAEYLQLQAEQGFDLSKYAGKRVKRYTYEVLNYPSGEQGVQAELLIFRNTVIGGEVLSPLPDGFLHGLNMPGMQ